MSNFTGLGRNPTSTSKIDDTKRDVDVKQKSSANQKSSTQKSSKSTNESSDDEEDEEEELRRVEQEKKRREFLTTKRYQVKESIVGAKRITNVVALHAVDSWTCLGEDHTIVGVMKSKIKNYESITSDKALILIMELLDRRIELKDLITKYKLTRQFPLTESRQKQLETEFKNVMVKYKHLTFDTLKNMWCIVQAHFKEIIPWWSTLCTGYALLSSFSHVAHSCEPNCILLMDVNHSILFATRPIQQGEPLTISFLRAQYDYPLHLRQYRLIPLLMGEIDIKYNAKGDSKTPTSVGSGGNTTVTTSTVAILIRVHLFIINIYRRHLHRLHLRQPHLPQPHLPLRLIRRFKNKLMI